MSRSRFLLFLAAWLWSSQCVAAGFGTRGGEEPANIDEVIDVLRQDPYDLELFISFGTSKGGSGGHSTGACTLTIPICCR